MILLQTPAPEIPPIPPIPDIPPIPPIPDFQGPMVFTPEVIPPWVPFIAIAGIIMVGIVLFPIVRALARRIEGKGAHDAELRQEIDSLHQRVSELEAVEQRMMELENRVEFSERLLTQARDHAPLERGSR